MSENKYQQPPANAEQVERVAMAIFDVDHGNLNDGPLWEDCEGTRFHYMDRASAAIAAMGGEKRWGILATNPLTGLKCWEPIGKSCRIFTTDHNLAIAECETAAASTDTVGFEVREYVEQAKVNADKVVAEECLLGYSLPPEVYEMFCDRITAAIENARKQKPS